MNVQARTAGMRTASFAAAVMGGVPAAFWGLQLLKSAVAEPGKLGTWNVAVMLGFVLLSSAAGALTTLALGSTLDRLSRRFRIRASDPARPTSRHRLWAELLIGMTLWAAAVNLVLHLPGLLAGSTPGPLPFVVVALAVGVAAAVGAALPAAPLTPQPITVGPDRRS